MKRRKQPREVSTVVDLRALADVVERFDGKRVVVLGDFVADYFQFGDISRVSREAPVLILRHRETRVLPGGGANAANNFVALGARVFAVSVVGDDLAGDSLLQSFVHGNMDVSGIVRVKDRVTPAKMRFLAGWAHTVGQQVLRVDYEPQSELGDSERRRIERLLDARVGNADALAVSDYGFGVVTPEMVQRVARRKRGLPITLDSRYHLAKYGRAGITAATPNEAEIEALHHTAIGSDIAELERCGGETLKNLKLKSLVVTRGRHGMAVFQPGADTAHIAVHGSDQAVDVTGAGDTVLAAYTLGLASGASALEAAHIANIAGGLVVMKRGTATVSRAELLQAIQDAVAGVAS
jgi:D-glycero-beta-D-manno-heptose-7-phosphate kinase